MERTAALGTDIHFGELEFTNLIKSAIRGYRFTHNNANPTSIVIPAIMEVEGVKVTFAAAAETGVRKGPRTKG